MCVCWGMNMEYSIDKIKLMFNNKKSLLIFIVIGVLFLLCGNMFGGSKTKKQDFNNPVEQVSVEVEEEKLERLLSMVKGAGKTKVMITYDTGYEKVTVQNSKVNKSSSGNSNDSGGEKESTEFQEENTTVMQGSGNSQQPFVSKEVLPRVRGVLVVAEGANNKRVNMELTDAVAAVLDVPYHKIKVLEKSN